MHFLYHIIGVGIIIYLMNQMRCPSCNICVYKSPPSEKWEFNFWVGTHCKNCGEVYSQKEFIKFSIIPPSIFKLIIKVVIIYFVVVFLWLLKNLIIAGYPFLTGRNLF